MKNPLKPADDSVAFNGLNIYLFLLHFPVKSNILIYRGIPNLDRPGNDIFRVYKPEQDVNQHNPGEREETLTMNKDKFILFIDDEQHILDALTRSLRKWLKEIKLEALTANSAHDAMEIITLHATNIAVIVCDQRMPDLNGSELTRIITKKSPDTTIIILSGHSTLDDMTDIISSGVFSFLQKPWD